MHRDLTIDVEKGIQKASSLPVLRYSCMLFFTTMAFYNLVVKGFREALFKISSNPASLSSGYFISGRVSV